MVRDRLCARAPARHPVRHLGDAFASENFAAKNFGVLLAITIALAALLPWLLGRVRAERAG